MAGSYHTGTVRVPSSEDLNEYLEKEEEQGYELISLTELTRPLASLDNTERFLVVTRKASQRPQPGFVQQGPLGFVQQGPLL